MLRKHCAGAPNQGQRAATAKRNSHGSLLLRGSRSSVPLPAPVLPETAASLRYIPPGSPLLEFGLIHATLRGGGCLLRTVNVDLITGYEDSAEALVSPVVERVPFPSTGTQRASTSASSTERIGLPM